jgi:hypothetical protein
MMGRICFVLLLLSLITSCNRKEPVTSPDIEGEWVYVDNEERYFKDYQGIRFSGGEYFTIGRSGPTLIGKYEFRRDSIIVDDSSTKLMFRIQKHTADSLLLNSEHGLSTFYNRKTEYNPELSLNELNIQAGACFGECPEFTLNINSDSIRFLPIKDCNIDRKASIKTDPATWKKLDSLFRWSRVQQIDTASRFMIIDDWAINLSVSYNKSQHIEIKGTYDGLPYRLRPVARNAISILKEQKWID